MNRPRSLMCLALVVFATLMSDLAASTWHHPLYLDGGRWWSKRVAVRVTNGSDGDLAGFPVQLVIGSESGQLPLAGERVESVRVCEEDGTELLFAAYRPEGDLIERGPLLPGGHLVLPVQCAAHGTAQFLVYFDNPSAGAVPDFLPTRARLINGDVESGTGDRPDGWKHDRSDDQRRATWSTENREF